MRGIALLLAASGLTLLLVAGCESDNNPVNPYAHSLIERDIVFRAVSGNHQTGAVGRELSAPLVAELTDTDSNPRAGYMVNWVIVAGGGAVWHTNAVTDAEGKTRNRWTLGPEPGTNAVEVRSVNPSGGNIRMHGTFIAIGVIPTDEVCNGIDDDVDGEVDEDMVYCFDGSAAPNTDGANSCLAGWEDSNGDPADGCEKQVGT